MTADARIAALVPHAGRMCVLERIVRWDETSVTAGTTTHRDPAHPLRGERGLRAIHLCEYGAQAMALHGGLAAEASGQRARPGVLVSLREVTLACDFVDDLEGELIVEARRLQASDDAWQYEFEVAHAGRRLAHGRATVSVASPA
jgi:predicted hotdog family 3-hydroxylacyl-ACP dehydratase